MSGETSDLRRQTTDDGRISKIVIANRGEIARRIMRTCRDLGIATVAVYSDVDEHEPFVSEADEGVRLPGATATETYLRGDLIVDAALATGATAIHPGYGFLSENAGFASACARAGVTFIGPAAASIESMGSKILAKEIMSEAGVPTLPSATVTTGAWEDTEEAVAPFAYPLLVKASAGGGGKGMRIVESPDDLPDAVAAATREAEAAFDDGTVFVERYLPEARHVEFQIAADGDGTTVHLFERECSIQRRHQKIIEETPSPALDADLRERMGAAAVAAARAVDYVGLGTVEFLLAGPDFYFLEMNTRLQVEHPVTEMVTGLDLVALQISIAEGKPLPERVLSARSDGHAIEARLYAEDPAGGFLPVAGTLERLRIPGTVRADLGPGDGSEIPVHYDPMIGKIAAHAPDREAAAAKLTKALIESEIYGITTNRDLLVRILRSDRFLQGDTTTAFLDGADAGELVSPLTRDHRLNALAATIAGQEGRRRAAPALRSIPSGWRNLPSALQLQRWECSGSRISVGYRFHRDGVIVELDGRPLDVVIHAATPETIDMTAAGVRRRFRVHRVGRRVWVSSGLGQSDLVQVSRFETPGAETVPGSLRSPMPGKVVAVAAAEGDEVAAGEVIVIIEAMKMEHNVTSPVAGVLSSVPVTVGDQVEADQVLAVVSAAPAE